MALTPAVPTGLPTVLPRHQCDHRQTVCPQPPPQTSASQTAQLPLHSAEVWYREHFEQEPPEQFWPRPTPVGVDVVGVVGGVAPVVVVTTAGGQNKRKATDLSQQTDSSDQHFDESSGIYYCYY